MYYTDDPLMDYSRYEADQERWLERLPVCADCGEPIQDSHCYEYNGEYICPQCNEDLHRKDVEDIVGRDMEADGWL